MSIDKEFNAKDEIIRATAAGQQRLLNELARVKTLLEAAHNYGYEDGKLYSNPEKWIDQDESFENFKTKYKI